MSKRKNMHLDARPSTFKHAATLRAQMTPAEIVLWEHLRERRMEGIRFRRQHPFSRYVGDFYAHSLKLTIEADGVYHDHPTQQIYDADRTENLNQIPQLTGKIDKPTGGKNTNVTLKGTYEVQWQTFCSSNTCLTNWRYCIIEITLNKKYEISITQTACKKYER